MADLADLAQIQNERAMELTLKGRKTQPIAATGVCLNCAEPLPDGSRWCSPECRDDWDRMDALLRGRGL